MASRTSPARLEARPSGHPGTGPTERAGGGAGVQTAELSLPASPSLTRALCCLPSGAAGWGNKAAGCMTDISSKGMTLGPNPGWMLDGPEPYKWRVTMWGFRKMGLALRGHRSGEGTVQFMEKEPPCSPLLVSPLLWTPQCPDISPVPWSSCP